MEEVEKSRSAGTGGLFDTHLYGLDTFMRTCGQNHMAFIVALRLAISQLTRPFSGR